MQSEDSWLSSLGTHPIFTPATTSKTEFSVDFSSAVKNASASGSKDVAKQEEKKYETGPRRVMCIRESDLILAVGTSVRITPLGEGVKATRKTFKTLHTPNINFEIRQVALNPTGKLLAVAGESQVAVIVLPRSGYTRLVTPTVDCRSIQVGQYYHATNASPRIAKLDWHPWGEGGSTLLIMTCDGTLREYDISQDAEEPQQVLHFLPQQTRSSYVADDAGSKEAVSFSIGKGTTDWDPLTIYTLMRNGDLWAMCPFMPTNASIPSAYIHALECFVSAKNEFLSSSSSAPDPALSMVYDYQVKYVNALMKQLPPGTHAPALSRNVSIHPPSTIKNRPVRQGPFLFQPSPAELDDGAGEGDDAVDLCCVAWEAEQGNVTGARLAVILVSFKDGRVDICLDVDKVEARWETRTIPSALPMLAVFETIDLGLIATISADATPNTIPWGIIHHNQATFTVDPIYPDTVYVSHALGVHCIVMRSWLQSVSRALEGEEAGLANALQRSAGSEVFWMLNTWSQSKRSTTPVACVALPDDVYVPYSLLALLTTNQLVPFELNLRLDAPAPVAAEQPVLTPTFLPPANPTTQMALVPTPKGPSYTSLLAQTPFTIPAVFARTPGVSPLPRLAVPAPAPAQPITPQALRTLGQHTSKIRGETGNVMAGAAVLKQRLDQVQHEYVRQLDRAAKMVDAMEKLSGAGQDGLKARMERVMSVQRELLARGDNVLQKLMDQHSPVLSEYEVRWFSELGRMRNEVVGANDGRALVARGDMLGRQLAMLMPTLKMIAKEEAEHRREASQTQGLGTAQALSIGRHLGEEGQAIDEAKRKLQDIADKLQVELDDAKLRTG